MKTLYQNPHHKLTKFKQETKKAESVFRDDSLRKTWIVYHLGAALAQRSIKNKTVARNIFRKICMDIHHFVLSACESCKEFHNAQLKETPIWKITDYEKWVFELHNKVNEKLGKVHYDNFETVRDHYRTELMSLGKGVTASLLSSNIPVLIGRYCYDC